jgi:hypothetical protein
MRLFMVAMNSAPTAPVTPAMATTGSFFTSLSDQAAVAATKKPRTFSGGASVKMMRSSDYARTAPEARQGFPVFAVRLVIVIMAREPMGWRGSRQWFLIGCRADRNWLFAPRKSGIGFMAVEQHHIVTQ